MTDTTVATSATTPDASRVAPNLFTFTGRRDGIQTVFCLGGLSRPITPFRTFVVLTTNRTSIGGPGLVTGPIQLYRVVKGDGTAQEVLF
jgi:hypothetical protein